MPVNSGSSSPYPSFDEVVRFHGHTCPGLATGYQASIAAMKALGVTRPRDEELVAIAETNACGVDAIQVVTGCTAGKGNLIIHDYGKHVFTFINRENGEAVRIQTKQPDIPERASLHELRPRVFSGTATDEEKQAYHSLMHTIVKKMLALDPEEMVTIEKVTVQPPSEAEIFASIPCECCGEQVADARTREYEGKKICIPCFLRKTGTT
ncbi:MAG: FmdE family protein [Methanospirillum sp.]|uniref:FmdE family protein n=1 Tax=Methanospirillum sp. TaxID=45200 RepID=UPI0023747049|nr:FmdE family protein [Methanospirillum sp.]MDD1728458.1 FmdE family protein [Methanospirillum sp.]